MKIFKPIKVESGFYPWGVLKGYRSLALTLEEVEDESVKLNTAEDYKELSLKMLQELKDLLKKEDKLDLFKSFTNPGIRGDKTRLLFRGTDIALTQSLRDQVTSLFNRITEEAIVTDKITGEKWVHPISFDIECKPLEASVQGVLTKTPRFVQENSFYRKFNSCQIHLDVAKLREDYKSVVGSLDAWKELEYHGQSYYGFVCRSKEDCEFIQKKFLDTNLLTKDFPGRVFIRVAKDAVESDIEAIADFAFTNSFRLDLGIKDPEKYHFLEA